jgi:tRNA-Thr(GGU) m(6)t(6)A37 methyltransferase TsaA
MKVIAHIKTDFHTKFGVPRQSGVVPELTAKIIFEPEYRVAEAFRGLENFSHIWILWCFSEAIREEWSPTVRPPRLGGNMRMGVFATRSPFRPNPIGLSSVRLLRVDLVTPEGPILYVSGADLMDGTPIYDIKPYLPYTDSHPDATGGFTDSLNLAELEIAVPSHLLELIPENKREALLHVLAADPRPHYQKDPNRIYGMDFAGLEIKFQVQDHLLTVISVV